MDSGPATVSTGDLSKTAETFGYSYRVLSVPETEESGEFPLFTGVLGMRRLPCGLRLCASDLTALKDSAHDGTVPRSLTIALVLDGEPADCAFGARGRLFLGRGFAAMVSIADAVRLAGRYRQGQRSRCLLVQTRPEDLPDEELAERVNGLLKSTSVSPFPASSRVLDLANDLFAPSVEGDLGRLLAESCALELLAKGLLQDGQGVELAGGTLGRRDLARMLRVRDLLVAEPARAHRLGDLAREAGMSVTSLKVKFTAAFGQPVFAFLRDLRLERAFEGLQSEGWTVSQAAYFVGYRHPSSFSIAFRRKFGVAPQVVGRSFPRGSAPT